MNSKIAHSSNDEAAWEDEIIRPLNWTNIDADQAAAEWVSLNEWVNWLRHAYGLPAAILPPFWHRHEELVWELSALHSAWLGAYQQPYAPAGAGLAWHHDFEAARARLREWVSISGTKIDQDRPTRTTTWPGEASAPDRAERVVNDRAADFAAFVIDDVEQRRAIATRAKASFRESVASGASRTPPSEQTASTFSTGDSGVDLS